MIVGFFVSRTIRYVRVPSFYSPRAVPQPTYNCLLRSNLVGYAYPAYASFKAIQDSKKEKYAEWLMYWSGTRVFL